MIPVEGYKGLYRDENTGAIINCNSDDLFDYLKTREIYKNQQQELSEIKNELNELKKLFKLVIEDKI